MTTTTYQDPELSAPEWDKSRTVVCPPTGSTNNPNAEDTPRHVPGSMIAKEGGGDRVVRVRPTVIVVALATHPTPAWAYGGSFVDLPPAGAVAIAALPARILKACAELRVERDKRAALRAEGEKIDVLCKFSQGTTAPSP